MERPIGYWLKHLDRLIEEAFGDALAEQALSRRHWQAMKGPSQKPASWDLSSASLCSRRATWKVT
jgi:hypothetical protein